MTSLAQKYMSLGDYVLRFLHWWGRELLSTLPNSWRSRLFRAPSEIEAHFDGAKLIFAGGGDLRPNWGEDRLAVILPERLFLAKETIMPAMDRRALARAAELFAETAFPLKREVLAVCVVRQSKSDRGKGEDKGEGVRIYCAKKRDIDLIEALCFDQQLPLAAIRPEGLDEDGCRGFLPKPLIRPRRSARQAMLAVFMTVAGLILALGIYSWRIGERIIELDESLARVRGDVQEMQDVAREADQAIMIWTELADEIGGVSLVQVLEDFSGVTPSSDHLTEFRLTGGTVRVSGLSANPTAWVTGIEGLAFTQGTRLISTTAARNSGQVVQITFEIDQGVADE